MRIYVGKNEKSQTCLKGSQINLKGLGTMIYLFIFNVAKVAIV